MKQEIKKLWVEALTSGKYSQTDEELHNDTGFCCLGVLCDIYNKQHNEDWTKGSDEEHPGRYHINTLNTSQEGLVLPPKVFEWAGLRSENPYVDHKESQSSLSELNDGGLSFKEIAVLINESLGE